MNLEKYTQQFNAYMAKKRKEFAQAKGFAWLVWTFLVYTIISVGVVLFVESPVWKVVLFGLGITLATVALAIAIGFRFKETAKNWAWLIAFVAFTGVFMWNLAWLVVAYFALTNDFVQFGNGILYIGTMFLSPLPMYRLGFERGMRQFKPAESLDEFLARVQKAYDLVIAEMKKRHDAKALQARMTATITTLGESLLQPVQLTAINAEHPLWDELPEKPEVKDDMIQFIGLDLDEVE